MIEWLRKLIGPDQETLTKHINRVNYFTDAVTRTAERHARKYNELRDLVLAERTRASRAEDEAAAARAYADSLVPDELRKMAILQVVQDFPAVIVANQVEMSVAPAGTPARNDVETMSIPPIRVAVEVGVFRQEELDRYPAATRAEMVAQHVNMAIAGDLKAELTRAIAHELGQ